MQSKTVYLAGSLFDYKALAGNVLLADAIEQVSEGQYSCLLPQDLEQAERAKRVRDSDLAAIAACDAIVCLLDGTELDSGTVVEKMVALMLVIPCVVVRTDFRKAGDGGDFSNEGYLGDEAARYFNLMVAYYPHTELVLAHAMADYKTALQTADGQGERSNRLQAIMMIHKQLADRIVTALDQAVLKGSSLHANLAPAVHAHFLEIIGFDQELHARVKQVLQRKRDH